ncbi:MAG: M50 family metallopeptidase [Archangiaceae bacterium]|nr:M50 family metallopeptidase [Archangiaceae bacterium]
MPSSSARLDGKRLLALIACVVLGVAAWEVPFLTPLKLLAVAGHETGHALATLLVGGSVNQIHIASDQSGDCMSMIPAGYFARIIVSSGGYVGASIIGALLLLLTFRFNWGKPMLAVAAAWLAAIGLFYGRDPFTFAFCIGMAVLFALGAKVFSRDVAAAVNLFLASFTALYAVMDLKDDLWSSAVRAQSDAAILAGTSGIPAVVWAFLWTVSSLLIVGAGAYLALKRQTRDPLGIDALASSRRALRRA